jgi:hypothetical protein
MTAADWLTSADPHAMLEFLRDSGKASDRKVRLFACGCGRSVWSWFRDERSGEALRTSERYADGLATRKELKAARRAAWEASEPLVAWEAAGLRAWEAAVATAWRLRCEAMLAPTDAVAWACHLLRDLFNFPLVAPRIEPAWLTWGGGCVPKLAQAAYEERKLPEGTLYPARLAVLADALEEAGCDNRDVLGHLRAPGPHLRGCWALDLLLNKG